ncbi:hypothetical protein DID88_005557 [Monilinia fructigena]|uniref:Uncharacterized protein n=1 Tax=Monilinia fructigena TaxID=38457 RepID=A0A395J1B8_9HELO|nr:hypothetical protein DID88_005557 [Monilinia fructigena]
MEPPHPFRNSLKNGNGMECIQSPRYFRNSINNGSRKESIESPQSLFSSRDDYPASSVSGFSGLTGDTIIPELSVETGLQELSDTTLNPSISAAGYGFSNLWKLSLSTSRATVLPSSSLKGSPTLLDIPEADSTSIKELPWSHCGQVPSGISWNNRVLDPISTTSDRSSHHSGFDSSRELKMVDAVVDKQNPTKTVDFLPVLSVVPSIQSRELRGSMCPAIQTDVHQFKDRYDLLHYQEDSSETLRHLSSPDTATTTTSGYSLSTDSGYGSVATESYHSSITSPRSSNSGNEKSGLDNLCSYQGEQLMSLSEFPPGNYSGQNIHSHSHSHPIDMNDFAHEELLDFPAAPCEINVPFRMQEMQASCNLGLQKNQFESDDTKNGHFCFDARMVKVIAEMGGSSLSDNFYASEEPQSSQSTFQSNANNCFHGFMPISDQIKNNGAHVSTQAESTLDQHNSGFLQFRETETAYTPPWSAESVRGFHWNANSTILPDTQLSIEGLATTPNPDNSFSKTGSKGEKCPYSPCFHEPRGQEKWKRERIHGIDIPKEKRNKQVAGIKPIKRARASGRAMKKTKFGPKNSQSQSASRPE